MIEYVLVWDEEAILDLKNIWYFLSKTSKPAAKKIIQGIERSAIKLKKSPLIGQEELSLSILNLGHRYIVKGNYKIVYRVINNYILVVTIFDTRQDPTMLFQAIITKQF
jgi:toxin ParE1/3/4